MDMPISSGSLWRLCHGRLWLVSPRRCLYCYWNCILTYTTALNYAFVGVGLAMSAVFLFRNLYVQTAHPLNATNANLTKTQIPSRLCHRCKAVPHSADRRRCLARWSGYCDQDLVLRAWISSLEGAGHAVRSHAGCSQGRRRWRQQDVLLGGIFV